MSFTKLKELFTQVSFVNYKAFHTACVSFQNHIAGFNDDSVTLKINVPFNIFKNSIETGLTSYNCCNSSFSIYTNIRGFHL